jgi:hypothetical protein
LPDGGCPIRRPLDRPLPARPQGFSQRGRVLHRQQAPRHPPCAHHRGSSHITHTHLLSFPTTHSPPIPARPSSSHPRLGAKPTRTRAPGGSLWCAPRQRGKRFLCLCPLPTRPSSQRPRVYVVCVLKCGAAGIRTPDLRRARAALSRLSYGPVRRCHQRVPAAPVVPGSWARLDSNQGPRSYQDRALTS